MAKWMGVAKAAKYLGVPRSLLQEMARQGDLHTFDGRVDLEELKSHFPAMAWDESPMVERARIIRNNAYARRLQDTLFDSQETLESQIRRLTVELAVHKTKEAMYREIIVDLMDKLSQLQHTDSYKNFAEELNAWLLHRFKQGN
ncbi:MAG: hypothetical protein OEZ68_08190 [Gammaproteobacteria bacterium]|nr:hypothetical protein [Gammaproteobacteria bacterium]MDH5800767.1 hypothetical protein [Gammaproteobacteria bacterium]